MTGSLEAAVRLIPLMLIGFGVAYTSVVWFIVRRLRNPPRRTYSWAVARNVPGDPGELDDPRDFESWTLRWSNAHRRALELPVWEIAGDDADGPAVVCTPGWGDSRVGALVRIGALLPHASTVVTWDPPGLGEADGRCALGTVEHRALAALVERVRAATSRPIVLYGWSLGAGVSLAAAASDKAVAGVIAEAPYRLPKTPARNVLHLSGLPHRVTLSPAFACMGIRLGVGWRWKGFDRAAIAARVEAPLLVLHGSGDAVSPPEDGVAVAEAAPRGVMAMIEGAGHNDLWTQPRFAGECAEAVRSLLVQCRAGAAAGA